MTDIEKLKADKDAYVKTEAEIILNRMIKNHVFTDTIATCDYPGWGVDLHRNMHEICAKLKEMGVSSSSTVNHGVTDWVFKLI